MERKSRRRISGAVVIGAVTYAAWCLRYHLRRFAKRHDPIEDLDLKISLQEREN